MYNLNLDSRSYVASGDLSALQYRLVDLLGNANFKVGVAAAQGGHGILLNKPLNGEAASVAEKGECQVRAGVALQAGQFITSAASGWAVNVSSTTTAQQVGRVKVGCASGMLAVVDLNPVKAPTV